MAVESSTPQTAALTLRKATSGEYCHYARGAAQNEFWWYLNGLAPYRGFSRPFADRTGRWWYCVKPGFAWPISFFEPLTAAKPPRRSLLGWQYPSVSGAANSTVTMNLIHDISGYDIAAVAENKRRAVRKGLKELEVAAVDPSDPAVCEWALKVWNSHVERTGWNRKMELRRFADTWKELVDWPGTTVLAAWPKTDHTHFCGWLIARIIDHTVYVDTIASDTECLAGRPNDAMIYTCLCSAKSVGVRHAHYSLKSDLTSLEEFKQSLGFVPHAFPARLQLRPGVGLALRLLRPSAYRRLRGDTSAPESAP